MRLFFFLCLLTGAASGQRFELTVETGTLKNGTRLFLSYLSGQQERVDTAVVQEGTCRFSGSISLPSEASLRRNPPRYDRGRDGFSFYLEPGVFTATSPDSLLHLRVKGSRLNDEDEEMKQLKRSLLAQRGKISAEYRNLPRSKQGNRKAVEDLAARENALISAEYEALVAFAEQHPASYLSLVNLEKVKGVAGRDTALGNRARAAYVRLDPAMRKAWLRRFVFASTEHPARMLTGKPAPDFALPTPAGDTVRLSAFRGKKVLLYFCAGWCMPCRQEAPMLAGLYEANKDKGFAILTVSMDHSRAVWENSIQIDRASWPVVSDLKGGAGPVAELYEVYGFPMSLLVDEHGIVIGGGWRGEELEQKINAVMAGKK